MLRYSPNLSISMMALSNTKLINENVQDYQELCLASEEGIFVNIVNQQGKSDRLVDQFFASMEVYPSTSLPIVKEFF